MTFVGKILVLVNLIMSVIVVAFAGGAVAMQTSWKAKYEAEQKSVKSAREETEKARAEAKTEVDRLNADIRKASADLENFRSQATRAQADLTRAKEELEKVNRLAGTSRDESKLSEDEAKLRRDEAVTLRTYNADLHAKNNALATNIRTLEDKIFNDTVRLRNVERKHETVLRRLSLAEKLIASKGLKFDEKEIIALKEPPIQVEGLVVNTRKTPQEKTELVEISIGKDDGIENGHVLYVYRNAGKGSYLGKIQIVYVEADKAVGTVIEKARNGVIQRGDNVTTKI